MTHQDKEKLETRIKQAQEDWNNRSPLTRLCIVQETGMQCGIPRYETHIHCFVPFDDEEFGKKYCAKLNTNTDLPFYLSKVEVKLIGKMVKYDIYDLEAENIKPLED